MFSMTLSPGDPAAKHVLDENKSRYGTTYVKEEKKSPYGSFSKDDELGQEIIKFVMPQVSLEARSLAQANIVSSFCAEVRLGDLKAGRGSEANAAIVHLIERSVHFRTGEIVRRPYDGAISTSQLYRKLQEARYHDPTAGSEASCAGSSASAPVERIIDAHQRFILVEDESPSAMVAIAATASFKQAEALQPMFQDHLQSSSFMNAAIVARFFKFRAHICHPVLRLAFERPDIAETCQGQPLRACEEATFLLPCEEQDTQKHPRLRAFIMERMASILTAGESEQTFVTYVFAKKLETKLVASEDAGEEAAEEENEEDILEKADEDATGDVYEDADKIMASKLLPDPLLCRDEGDAARPVRQPREYHLRVLNSHVSNAVDEWRNVLIVVRKGFLLFHRRDKAMRQASSWSSLSTEERHKALQERTNWVNEADNLSAWLMTMLQGLIRNMENFMLENAMFFQDIDESARCWMASLHESFITLREMREDLLSLQEQLKASSNQLDRELGVGSHGLASLQERLVNYNKWVLIGTSVFFLPVGLVSQVFSVGQYLPFPATSASFGISIGVITLWALMLVLGPHILSWVRTPIRSKINNATPADAPDDEPHNDVDDDAAGTGTSGNWDPSCLAIPLRTYLRVASRGLVSNRSRAFGEGDDDDCPGSELPYHVTSARYGVGPA